MPRCVKPFFRLLTSFLPLSICAAPSREAAAKEGNYALCAIDVNPSFDPPKENGIDAADLSSLPVAAPENPERLDEDKEESAEEEEEEEDCLLYTSPSPRDGLLSRMPSSA